jgi:LacI family transcriptional regulator
MDPGTPGAHELMVGFNSVAQVRGWEVYRPGRTHLLETESFGPHGVLIGPGVTPVAVSKWAGPMVSIAGDLSAHGIPSVTSDDFSVGTLAAAHLQQTGITKFAYFGDLGSSWSRLRRDGFSNGLAKANLTCSCWAEQPAYHMAENWSADTIGQWIKSLEKPVAVFAGCDGWGRIFLRGCRVAGVRVPEDVAVLGVDNYEFECSMANPPLSSVDIAWHKMGEESALQLERALRGECSRNERIQLPPIGVVARVSTDIVAIEDPHVAAALRFIRQHADKPISVADILQEVPTFQHNLERGFRKHLGRTMLAEIRRVRVERAKRLLSTTGLSIEDVARHCGFPTATKLGIAFRRETGSTPGAYRKKYRK